VFDPVEGCAYIVLFAVTVVMRAFAEAYAAEVEAKDRNAEGREGLHRVIDNFVVHGAAASRMRMADERGVWGVVAASVEERLESAGRTAEIVDRTDLGGCGLGHLLQFIGCLRYSFFMRDTVC